MVQETMLGTITPRPLPVAESPDGCDLVGRQLAKAIRTVDLENRRMRAAIAQRIGVSDSEFAAITTISELEIATPTLLAQGLGLTSGTVTALTDRLECAGLIVRRPHPTDRRSLVLELSPAGEAVREWIYGTYLQAIRQAACETGDDEATVTAAVLLKVASIIRYATVSLPSEIPGYTPAGR